LLDLLDELRALVCGALAVAVTRARDVARRVPAMHRCSKPEAARRARERIAWAHGTLPVEGSDEAD
jgi:hypothetical protein